MELAWNYEKYLETKILRTIRVDCAKTIQVQCLTQGSPVYSNKSIDN